MTVVIKKTSDQESIKKILKQLEHKSKFDVTKFCGVLQLDKSPLIIQKEMRNEWE